MLVTQNPTIFNPANIVFSLHVLTISSVNSPPLVFGNDSGSLALQRREPHHVSVGLNRWLIRAEIFIDFGICGGAVKERLLSV